MKYQNKFTVYLAFHTGAPLLMEVQDCFGFVIFHTLINRKCVGFKIEIEYKKAFKGISPIYFEIQIKMHCLKFG